MDILEPRIWPGKREWHAQRGRRLLTVILNDGDDNVATVRAKVLRV